MRETTVPINSCRNFFHQQYGQSHMIWMLRMITIYFVCPRTWPGQLKMAGWGRCIICIWPNWYHFTKLDFLEIRGGFPKPQLPTLREIGRCLWSQIDDAPALSQPGIKAFWGRFHRVSLPMRCAIGRLCSEKLLSHLPKFSYSSESSGGKLLVAWKCLMSVVDLEKPASKLVTIYSK